ncbi:MAG: hypothetical protein H6656_04280 [Ardenticatenaceae bacterium]|nr:hypothetical protein [Ardenticatenaceae bacterium]
MRKFKIFSILIVMTMLLVTTLSISAQSSIDGSGWWTNFTIQNTTSNAATVATVGYHPTGGSSDTYSDSTVLNGNTSVIFHPGLGATCPDTVNAASSGCRIGLTPSLPSGFQGSVVISSDSPVVAVTSLNNNASGSVGVSSGTARSSYQGIDGSVASDTLYFPTVKRDFSGQSTIFFVQAAGSEANVTITYEMNDGSTHTQNQTIAANKMFAFAPSAATPPVASCNGGNGGGSAVAACFGGATVTSSSGPIAGVVVEYITNASTASYVLASRGLTPTDAGTEIIAPAMKNDFNGSTTGATILNTGGSTAQVTIESTVTNVSSGCSANIGQVYTQNVSIPSGSSIVVNRFQGNTGTGHPNCTFYTMKATSTNSQPIVMTVNENRNYLGQTVKAVYAGFNVDSATNTVFFPLSKEFLNGQTSGLSVVNAGTTSTKITGTFTCSDGTHVIETSSNVAAGAAVAFFNLSGGNSNFTAVSGGMPSADVKCSVVMTSNGGQPLVGLAQESDRDSSNGVLDITNYEGFNQ